MIIAINQLEYKKDLCCLSLGDWTKLPPHFMCQCYAQQVMRSAVTENFFSIDDPSTKRAGRQKNKTKQTKQNKATTKETRISICSTDQENKANKMFTLWLPV